MWRKRTAIPKHLLYWALLFFSLNASAQQTCSDSTLRNRLFLNQDSSLVITRYSSQLSANSYLILKNWRSSSTVFNSIISKKDPQGNVLWSRNFSANSVDSSLLLSQILELNDGSSFVLGTIQSKQSPFRVSPYPVLLRLDNSGNTISSWRIDLKEGSLINGFFNCFLCQVDANSVALLINYTSEDITSQFVVLKLDISTGNCLWVDKFSKDNFFYADGMLASANQLLILSSMSNSSALGQRQGINLLKLNSTNGALANTKSYENSFVNSLPSATSFAYLRRIKNGNYKAIYGTSKDNEANKIICVEFDDNLNIVQTKATGNIKDIYLVRAFSINNSGAFAFNFFNAANPNDQGYIAIDSSFKIVQQRKLSANGNNFSVAFSNNELFLSDNNRLTVFSNVNTGSQIAVEAITTHIYNKDSSCIGTNFNDAQTENFFLQASSWLLNQEMINMPSLQLYTVGNANASLQNNEICSSIKRYDTNLPDSLMKCNGDTLTITASSVFDSYAWQPDSYSIPINDSSIKVFPPVTESYFLSAINYLGCTVKDTVAVIVNKSQLIRFPNDTSICSESSVVLDGGNSFISYLWSDGSTKQYKTISKEGAYSLQAMDSNHCISRDTFQLLNVFPKPSVNIHQKQVLCIGQSDQLYAGNYYSYLWQDGTNTSSYPVRDKGIYSVVVTDNYGCTGSDSVVITELVHAPTNFIVHDTAICSSQSITLKPFTTYASYLWDNGSRQPFIEINHAGNYSLKVTDQNGCVGQEQITVSEKQCPNVLLFPTAFTPNGDGKNDLFKPLAQGSFASYQLSIYNRWGQKIFSTKDPLKGWDGKLDNSIQDGVFVWSCNYQFKGEIQMNQKGTVALVK